VLQSGSLVAFTEGTHLEITFAPQFDHRLGLLQLHISTLFKFLYPPFQYRGGAVSAPVSVSVSLASLELPLAPDISSLPSLF